MNNLLERAISKFEQGIENSFGAWSKSREYIGDPNYNLDLVNQGFADLKVEKQDDSKILNRICKAYNKAKDIQQHKSPIYRPSNEWLPIYEQPLKEVITALTNSDVNSLSRIYSNFWRDDCSKGLIGLPVDMKKHFFEKKIKRRYKMMFLNDFICRYKLWQKLLGKTHSTIDLQSPNIGNQYGYFIEGKFIKAGSDYLHYYATTIGRLIKSETSNCVVELGGGFGGMAYYLLRDNQDITYIDLDLPENMALTAYYLLKAFPKKKILLFGEEDLTSESIQKYDAIIMPSFEIEHLPENFATLVFNSYSLAEMSKETISSFIKEFTRIILEKGYFLHVNHNKNSLVIADDFGVSPDQFNLLSKTPALWNMGRNSHMDEDEYLYRKISDV
jgi:putative sugar O-methyltransferase